MASKNNQETATPTELERLRDILFGEYARHTELKIEDIESHLNQFRREILKALSDQESIQANQLETTRQALDDKLSQAGNSHQALENRLDQFAADVNQQIAALREEMNEHLARLADELTNRRVLGRLLTDLGQELQGTAAEEPGD